MLTNKLFDGMNKYNIINSFIEIIQEDLENYDILFNQRDKHKKEEKDVKEEKEVKKEVKEEKEVKEVKEEKEVKKDVKDVKEDKEDKEGKEDKKVKEEKEVKEEKTDRDRINLRYNDDCANNYLLELEDYKSFISIPPVENFLNDISPSYKYLENNSNDKKNTCICYATYIIPTILNIRTKNNSIKNKYYSNNDLENIKNNAFEVRCDTVINLKDMLLYTGILDDGWYKPINNMYSIGDAIKQNIYNNNIIISDYCVNIFKRVKYDTSFLDFKIKYEKDKLKVIVEYTEKQMTDMEYLIYTIFMGKEFADNKFNLDYTKFNAKNHIQNIINKNENVKCINKDNKPEYLKYIINDGQLENHIKTNIKYVHQQFYKRAKLLEESLNNFRIGNTIGYYSLHLICGHTFVYLLKDKIELLREKKMYDMEDFDNAYNKIKKYGDVFNIKLQKIFKINIGGGNNDRGNKFSYYKHNTDGDYIEFINDFYKLVNENWDDIKKILNKQIK